MLAATDFAGIAVLVTALGTFVVACATAYVAVKGRQETAEVAKEVRTSNALKMGEASDATETRRVEAIPFSERTAAEQEHLDNAPPEAPPQGPNPDGRDG